jgi:hypothetical protein
MALEARIRLGIIAKQRGDLDVAIERLKSVMSIAQSNDMISDIWTQIGHVYEMKSDVRFCCRI